LFILDDSGALRPSEFCAQYETASAHLFSKRHDLLLGISNTTDHHFSEGPGQTSESNSTSMEISMYTFMPTKEEEERINKKKKI